MIHTTSFSLVSRHSSRRFASVGLAAFLSSIAMATTAMAGEECGDTTCEKGFVCITGEATCDAVDGTRPDAATGGASSSGGATSDDGEPADVCETITYAYCEPAPCTADSDCGADMTCVKNTWETCTVSAGGPTCDPADPDCEDTSTPSEPVCIEESMQRCEYKWNQPCKATADCGEGFTCQEQEVCSCGSSGTGGAAGVETPTSSSGVGAATSTGSAGAVSESGEGTDSSGPARGGAASGSGAATGEGSGRAGASSGGATGADGSEEDPTGDDVAPPDCVCEPQCVPVEVTCETAADCPANWECAGDSYMICEDREDGSGVCETIEDPKRCVPPGYRGGSDGTIGLDDSGATQSEGEGEAATDKENEEPPTSAGPTGADDHDADEAGADDVEEDADDEDAGDSADEPAKASGGCSVAAPVSGRSALSFVMLAFAAAIGLGRRRSTR